MKITIEGRPVEVDDKFRDLSPADKEATVEELAIAMKAEKASETTVGDVGQGVASGATGGAINIVPGIGALAADVATAPGLALYQGIDAAAGLAGYDTGLAQRYKPGGYFGHSAESARLSRELAEKLVEPPKSAGGRVARELTSGGVEALGGTGLFRLAGRVFNSYDDAVRFAEEARINPAGINRVATEAVKEMGAAPVAQGVYGAAAGGGAEVAEQQGLPPIVGTLAGIGGAAAGHTALRGAQAAPRALADAAEEQLQRTGPTQERAAAERLRKSATDSGELDVWAQRAREAEDAFAAETAKGDAANPRVLQQLDQARREAHGELVAESRPTLFEATGDTGIGGQERRAFQQATPLDRDSGSTFRTEMESRRADQNAARLDEIDRVGGEGRPAALLDEFKRQRDELDRRYGQAEETAQLSADVAATKAGTTQTPEAIGTAIREPLAVAQKAAKAAGGRLYDAIGAEGVTVGTGRLKAAVAQHFKDIPESPLTGDEKHFADLVKGYGGRLDFDLLQKLRSEIAGRARQYTLPDTVRRRFTLLKNAIDEAMDDGLARAVKDDPTLMQRAAASVDDAARRQAEAWGVTPPPQGRAQASPTAVVEPIDDALTQQQREANRHWREMKQTFGAKPVEPILKGAPTASGYKLTEAAIPETAFPSGNTGAEQIRALRAAGATDAALAEAAALSLQKTAIRDGAIDPAAFRRWLNNYGPAIRELPPEVQRRFSSAASASATLVDAAKARQAATRQFDQSAVGEVLGIPLSDLEQKIGAYLTTPSKAHELANRVAGDPAAKAGLQRLVVDHILRRFTNASDDLSKGSLATYVDKNKAQLGAIFGNDGARRWERLVADIERSRKQMTVGKDPAGPGTAGDLASMAKPAAGATVMTLIAHGLGPKGIMAAGIAKSILSNMKLAGIADVDALFAQALLDPELAQKLLTKGPALKNEKFLKGLGATILRSAVLAGARGDLRTEEQ